uniref:Uncharacterized protein n=1 Tax=Oryza rufipogon TaxID=4529 RepID=A0A0E0QFV0_ORYRU
MVVDDDDNGPSQTVLRSLTDDETLILMKALHKLFFGPSRIDDDASFDGKLMMMVNSDELLMTKTSSDVKLVRI